MSQRPVYIVAAQRTAIGKAFRGSLTHRRPDDFGAECLKATLAKVPQLDPATIEDVMVGCAMPEAEQGMNVGRFISLLAGLPDSVPAMTINRFCSSGLQTIAMAADRIRGGGNCVVAGGVESMSLIPMMGHKVVGSRTIMDQHPEFYLGMGMTAENVADEYKVSRQDQDQFAYESHRKSVEAIEKGLFRDEIVPVHVESRKLGKDGQVEVQSHSFSQDEGPRPDTSVEALAKLSPAFKVKGSVTAGNSSQMSDGAAFLVLVSEEYLKQHKLEPLARFVSFAVAGVPPRVMGIGPIEAIPRALKEAGIKSKDIGHTELNEAFAAQALAVIRHLDLDAATINPFGGAISLGHPLGATGAKLAATVIHNLRRGKHKHALVSMCIGTGMGAAGVFERI